MKITFIGGFYPEIGGPFSALKNLLHALSYRNHNVSIISALPSSYDKNKLRFIKDLPFKVRFLRQGLFSHIIPSYSKYWKKELQHKVKETEIFHINGMFDHYSMLISNLNEPYVLSLRGSFMKNAYKLTKFKEFKKKIFMKLLGRRILNRAALIHVMCQKELEDFLSFFPDLKEKVRIIPNGLNLSEFQNLPSKKEFIAKYPILRNKKYILFLGRLHKIKGLDLILKAFDTLVKEKDLYLVIAGEDDGDGYKNKIKKWIKEYGLKDRVIFTGMLHGTDKLSAFVDAKMFVLASYFENFGMAVVEAMACGTPVVISDKVGISREVEENNAGIIVETNPQSVYDGIKNLLDNHDLKNKISENGKKMVEKYYDVNKVADKMIEMYEEVIKRIVRSKKLGVRRESKGLF
ncbi:MAG: glycosyltransferase [Elusimicrobia bacterium]|nr:glycosyltransferase [Elusimicrobiota bacterium]